MYQINLFKQFPFIQSKSYYFLTMSCKEIKYSDNSKTLYIFLENGWGNMILELLAGYSLADFMLPEKYKVVGLLTPVMMSTHQTVYDSPHQQSKLPHPLDLSAILPRCKFENMDQLDHSEMLDLHETYPDWLSDKKQELVIRADWMQINLELIIPRLSSLQKSLNNFRPSTAISEYLTRCYSAAFSNQRAVGLHVRVRQPGDIMSHMKVPVAKWYADALKRFESLQLKEVFLVSGISTGHEEAKQSLDEIQQAITSQFPDLKIYAMYDEPYYIDFFFLAHMPNLIIANSSFSVTAAILGSKWGLVKRVLVPPQVVELSPEISKLPGFEEVPGDDFMYFFRSDK